MVGTCTPAFEGCEFVVKSNRLLASICPGRQDWTVTLDLLVCSLAFDES